MAAYKLSKNGWVMPFFVIFSLAREKLLVTVAFDHPVDRTASQYKRKYLSVRTCQKSLKLCSINKNKLPLERGDPQFSNHWVLRGRL